MQFITKIVFPYFSVYNKIYTVRLILQKNYLFQTLTLKFDLDGSFVKFDPSQNRILCGIRCEISH